MINHLDGCTRPGERAGRLSRGDEAQFCTGCGRFELVDVIARRERVEREARQASRPDDVLPRRLSMTPPLPWPRVLELAGRLGIPAARVERGELVVYEPDGVTR